MARFRIFSLFVTCGMVPGMSIRSGATTPEPSTPSDSGGAIRLRSTRPPGAHSDADEVIHKLDSLELLKSEDLSHARITAVDGSARSAVPPILRRIDIGEAETENEVDDDRSAKSEAIASHKDHPEDEEAEVSENELDTSFDSTKHVGDSHFHDTSSANSDDCIRKPRSRSDVVE